MMRHCFILVFTLSLTTAFCQPKLKLDSLVNALKQVDKSQTKIDLYERICWYHVEISSDLVTAQKYADSVRILAKELKSEKGFFQAEYNDGVIAAFKGNYPVSQEHLEAVIKYAKEKGDSAQLGKGLYHLANIQVFQGNYEKALGLYYRLLAIEERANNTKKIGSVLNAIGAAYKKISKFPEGVAAYKQATKIFKAANLKVDYAMGLTNMANIFILQEHYDSAKLAYNEALAIFYDFKNPIFIAATLGNLGNLYEARNMYDSALQYHKRALAVWRQDTRKSSLANSLNNNGKCYLKLKNYAAADSHLMEAMQIALQIKAKPLLVDIYSNINTVHFERKEFEKAYHYYALSNQIKDSLFNETNTKQINELQAKYETAKKDQQITLLAKEKEVQKKEAERRDTLNKAYFAGLIFMLLLGGLLFYTYRQRTLLAAKNTQLKEADLRHQVSELEMKALRAQINPHFLFNCINAINLMIRKGESEKACTYLAKFSKLVRLILENAETSAVTLESEISLMEAYIQLEELRFVRKVEYKIDVDKSIGADSTYLPSMVLQPVIENAIWHGIVHKENEATGVINVTVSQDGDELLCTVEDNGVGRERAKELRDKSLLNNKSLGMKITEERLRLLSRKRSSGFIEITDLKDSLSHAVGTRVLLHIPIAEQ
jgi:tetratricopeptide (TPR) repeat protein